MEFSFFFGVILIPILAFLSLQFVFSHGRRRRRQTYDVSPHSNLPPGKMGFPFFGETFGFIKSAKNGKPEDFIFKRMSKFCPKIFKTSIIGEPTVVLCGVSGNKFLFSNEEKLVTSWWPNSLKKIFPSQADKDGLGQESKKMRKMLPNFLNPEALKGYINIMDSIAQNHFKEFWDGRQQVTVYPLSMSFTFHLACRLFLSMEDTEKVTKFGVPFHILSSGIFCLPINFPGAGFYRAIKASKVIRDEITSIIKERKIGLLEKKDYVIQDILTHMLLTVDEEGQYSSELDMANWILGLLMGGIDTASSVLTTVVNYLADLPEIYNQVYMEQMEIARLKKPGELLNWDDIQKMKYSWNVACEAMRIAAPLAGTFRMAITDFTFAGFFIPNGWKLYWSTHGTHKNPEYFSQPEKFDPSRFEGNGPTPYSYVPFGGGPRMCPGKEYARLEILVFMHNLVKRYKWEKLLPHSKITMNPLPTPTKGLPILLIPHPG